MFNIEMAVSDPAPLTIGTLFDDFQIANSISVFEEGVHYVIKHVHLTHNINENAVLSAWYKFQTDYMNYMRTTEVDE